MKVIATFSMQVDDTANVEEVANDMHKVLVNQNATVRLVDFQREADDNFGNEEIHFFQV